MKSSNNHSRINIILNAKIQARTKIFSKLSVVELVYINPQNNVVVPAIIASNSISLCFEFLYGSKNICTLADIVKTITESTILHKGENVVRAANMIKIRTFLRELTNSQ